MFEETTAIELVLENASQKQVNVAKLFESSFFWGNLFYLFWYFGHWLIHFNSLSVKLMEKFGLVHHVLFSSFYLIGSHKMWQLLEVPPQH